MDWLKERMEESSTWRGVVAFATGIATMLHPEMIAEIMAAGMSILGMMGFGTKDKK